MGFGVEELAPPYTTECVCALIDGVGVWCDCCEHTRVTVTNIIVPLSRSEANAGARALHVAFRVTSLERPSECQARPNRIPRPLASPDPTKTGRAAVLQGNTQVSISGLTAAAAGATCSVSQSLIKWSDLSAAPLTKWTGCKDMQGGSGLHSRTKERNREKPSKQRPEIFFNYLTSRLLNYIQCP